MLAQDLPIRRACPGLSAPMPTGDGLLVRFVPVGTIALDAFAKLCAAAREHGNGIIEITARGNIQVRGLNPASAPRFAAAVAALGVAAQDGVPVISSALAGLDADEILDAGTLAADVRRALARAALAARLAPKVSVVIDGGGKLTLAGLAADVRLCAEATARGPALRVEIGGDAARAVQLGLVAPAQGVEAATRLLEFIARHGRHRRARELIATEGVAPFHAALGMATGASAPLLRGDEKKNSEPIGVHALRDESLACGVGLAFGHADAASLEGLAKAAHAAGANGLRVAPERALMTIGLTPHAALPFIAAAERLGFIVHAADPRRRVAACAGAPICAAAHIAARAMAPNLANVAAPFLDNSLTIHVSGCAKGCAHPATAALTVVGVADGCALVADGSARDAPFAVVAADALSAAVARYARQPRSRAGHG